MVNQTPRVRKSFTSHLGPTSPPKVRTRNSFRVDFSASSSAPRTRPSYRFYRSRPTGVRKQPLPRHQILYVDDLMLSWDCVVIEGHKLMPRLRSQEDVPVYGSVSCVYHSLGLILEIMWRRVWFKDRRFHMAIYHPNIAETVFLHPPDFDNGGIVPTSLFDFVVKYGMLSELLFQNALFGYRFDLHFYPRRDPDDIITANNHISNVGPAMGLMRTHLSAPPFITPDRKPLKLYDDSPGSINHAVTLLAVATIVMERGERVAGYKVFDSWRPLEAYRHDGIYYVLAHDLDEIVCFTL